MPTLIYDQISKEYTNGLAVRGVYGWEYYPYGTGLEYTTGYDHPDGIQVRDYETGEGRVFKREEFISKFMGELK